MRPRGSKQIVICCGEMEGRKVGGELVSGEGRRAGPEDRARRRRMEGGPAESEDGEGVKVQTEEKASNEGNNLC